jgi:hypothetical protein
MCTPGTLTGFQIAGGVNSALGAWGTSSAQKTALGASANAADINAKMAEDSAQTALLAGQHEQQKIEMNTTRMEDEQTTGFAAHGIDLSGGGTPTEMLASTKLMGDADVATAKANAVRTAWGYRTEGTNYTNEGISDRAGAKGISPFMAAGASMLTSASSIAQTRYMMQKAGVPGTQDDWYSSTIGKL